jgi:hypothetical protein
MRRDRYRRLPLAAAAAAMSMLATAAHASESCTRSRDYLLGGLAGELPQTPQSYKQLFNICTATADLSNVKDAYLLKDGGIGVVAKNDGVAATAATLSDFCRRFPRATLRFISRKDQERAKTIAQTVAIGSLSATSCRKIQGLDS